jgi:hypothetical protein
VVGRDSHDYYEASVPSTALGRQRTCPPPDWLPGGRATVDGSHVHYASIGQGGAQLYSDSIATATPQAFTVASPPEQEPGFGVDHRLAATITRCTPARIHQIGAGSTLTELQPLVHSRYAF